MADGDVGVQPHLNRADYLALPVIVLGEYKYGIRKSRYRAQYEKWLAELSGHSLVLAVDEETTEHYAELRSELRRSGHPIPANDVWIAALVRQHALPLLSRDRHFDLVPRLKRFGW